VKPPPVSGAETCPGRTPSFAGAFFRSGRQFALRVQSRCDARMADNRTISQLEAEDCQWIGCECCKGTV
jgi:hypothetical protein